MKRIRNTKKTHNFTFDKLIHVMWRGWYKMAETLTSSTIHSCHSNSPHNCLFYNNFSLVFIPYHCRILFYEFPLIASNNCYQSNRSWAFFSSLCFCADLFNIFFFLHFNLSVSGNRIRRPFVLDLIWNNVELMSFYAQNTNTIINWSLALIPNASEVNNALVDCWWWKSIYFRCNVRCSFDAKAMKKLIEWWIFFSFRIFFLYWSEFASFT